MLNANKNKNSYCSDTPNVIMKCLKEKCKPFFIISCACLLPPTLLGLLVDLSLSTSHMFTYLIQMGPKLLLLGITDVSTYCATTVYYWKTQESWKNNINTTRPFHSDLIWVQIKNKIVYLYSVEPKRRGEQTHMGMTTQLHLSNKIINILNPLLCT